MDSLRYGLDMQEIPNQERQEFNLLLAQAKDALVETNFEEAESKYHAALELGRNLFPEPTIETVSCLIGLGDSFFGASKFEQAKALFQEALDEFDRVQTGHSDDKTSQASDETMQASDRTVQASHKTVQASDRTVLAGDETVQASDRTVLAGDETVQASDETVQARDETVQASDKSLQASDKIPALLKLAKTLTVLKEFSQADNIFAETVALAEPTLPLGNPILTGIYEAYANMLADGKLDPGTEREEYFREKARVCRGKFTPPKRPPAKETRSDLPKLRRAAKPTASLFDGGGSGLFLSPMVWLARNFKILLILLMVSVCAYAFTDKTVRTQFENYFGSH